MNHPPRVVPSLDIKIGSQTFSCLGNGLITNGHCFCSNIQTFFHLLDPKTTEAGKVAAHEPDIPWRAEDSCKAQCAFRGLSLSGTVVDMEDRLRDSLEESGSDYVTELNRGPFISLRLVDRR